MADSERPVTAAQAAPGAQATVRPGLILSIVLHYASLAALWILLSNQALDDLAATPPQEAQR
jgi:hypothetical protein